MSTTHAISAAHCYRRYFFTLNLCSAIFSAETVQAMAGAHNIREKEESQQVTRLRRFVKHPNYNEFLLTADLASLEFATPLTFNGFVQES